MTVAASPVPAISGGTLRVLSDGVTAVAADPDRDGIDIVDLTAGTVRAHVALSAGDEPGRVVEDANGRVHVALRRGGAVVTLNPVTGAVTDRTAVCSAPRGLAYDPGKDQVHVACAGGELVSLPAAGGVAVRTLTLEPDLRDIVVGFGGELLVSTFRHAEVLVVGVDGAVAERLRPASGQATSPLGTLRAVSPAVAWRMVPAADASGGVVMLHQMGVDDLIDPSAGGYAGLRGCSAIVQSTVSVLTPGGVAPTTPVGLASISLAVDIAVSPDGTQVAVASAGTADGATTPLQKIGVTTMPAAGSVSSCMSPSSPNGGTAFPPGQVVAVSYSKDGTLYAQTREPATLWRSDTGLVANLAIDSRSDTGHLLFHVNAGGGIACASCHPEGGEDGRVWNFACLGKRRTQSIRGGIGGTEPFHWDGDEVDFSHLVDDVFVQRMSGPQLNSDQKTALLSWIDTVPALPRWAGVDTAAVARGQALFADTKVACASCHVGALLTNNTTVDVGTGGPFQVPSLRGVSWRAPFMHDGCAPTLMDRFGACGGGDKHGNTSPLSSAQMGDLVAYLQSL